MSPRPTPPASPAPCVLTASSQLMPTRGGWLVDGALRPSLSGCRVHLRAGEELRVTLHTAEERAPSSAEPVAPAIAEPAPPAPTVAQVLVPPPPGAQVPPPSRGLGGAGAVLLALGLAYLRYGRPRGRDRAEPCTLAPRVEALEWRVEALEREARERGSACPARELLERVGV